MPSPQTFYCTKCDKSYQTKNTYEDHLKYSTRHDENNRKNWPKCDVCNTAVHPHELLRHKRKVHTSTSTSKPVGIKKPLKIVTKAPAPSSKNQKEQKQTATAKPAAAPVLSVSTAAETTPKQQPIKYELIDAAADSSSMHKVLIALPCAFSTFLDEARSAASATHPSCSLEKSKISVEHLDDDGTWKCMRSNEDWSAWFDEASPQETGTGRRLRVSLSPLDQSALQVSIPPQSSLNVDLSIQSKSDEHLS